MLTNRVLQTLKFFDLQDYPLTAVEVWSYLLPEIQEIKARILENGEIQPGFVPEKQSQVSLLEVLECLDSQCAAEVESFCGFYFLKGRKVIAEQRWAGYFYGIQREKKIKKFAKYFKYLPFVRGVALTGSQALGLQKKNSDIDLLIFTDSKFLGLARFFVTLFFQIFGVRRYGKKVANRFCLNHYLAGVFLLNKDKNIYTAVEYTKLRTLYGEKVNSEFIKLNSEWIQAFLPNLEIQTKKENFLNKQENFLKRNLEKIFLNSVGQKIEHWFKKYQISRVQAGEFVVAEASELSFHPENRKPQLFQRFFKS